MRNGVIQDWGLVEFFDAQEAEQTQERMNGYNLGGRNIRWEFDKNNFKVVTFPLNKWELYNLGKRIVGWEFFLLSLEEGIFSENLWMEHFWIK